MANSEPLLGSQAARLELRADQLQNRLVFPLLLVLCPFLKECLPGPLNDGDSIVELNLPLLDLNADADPQGMQGLEFNVLVVLSCLLLPVLPVYWVVAVVDGMFLC